MKAEARPARFSLWHLKPDENESLTLKLCAIMQKIALYFGLKNEHFIVTETMSFTNAINAWAHHLGLKALSINVDAAKSSKALPIIARDRKLDQPVLLLPLIFSYFVVFDPSTNRQSLVHKNVLSMRFDEFVQCLPAWPLNKNKNTKSSWLGLGAYFPSHAYFVLALLSSSLGMAMLFFNAIHISDKALDQHWLLSVAALLCLLTIMGLAFLMRDAQRNEVLVLAWLYNDFYTRMLKTPQELMAQQSSSDRHHLISSMHRVAQGLFQSRAEFLFALAWSLALVVVLFYLSFKGWLTLVILSLLLLMLARYLAKKTATLHKQHCELKDELFLLLEQYGSAIYMIKHLGSASVFIKKINRIKQELSHIFAAYNKWRFLALLAQSFGPLLLILALNFIAWPYGNERALWRELFIFTAIIVSGFIFLRGVWARFDMQEAKGKWQTYEAKALALVEALPLKLSPIDISGELSVMKLSFRYEDSSIAVLNDLNFHLAPKSSLLVHGPSASGKTTLIKILCGLNQAQHGEIRFDGQDLQSLNQDKLRQHLGVVLSESKTFAGSVYQNIICGRPIRPKALMDLLLSHDFFDVLLDMPMGLQTYIFWHGKNISRIQQCAIMLARALIHKPALLLLDQPFDGLDEEQRYRLSSLIQCLPLTRVITAHEVPPYFIADQVVKLG